MLQILLQNVAVITNCDVYYKMRRYSVCYPFKRQPGKWSNTLKQFVGNLPTSCLSVFDHFMNLALKGL